MNIGRALVAVAVVAALGSTTVAYAATMTSRSHTLGAGTGTVGTCDTAVGFTSFVRSGTGASTMVTGFTVNDIAPACAGAQLHVTLTDSANTSLGSGSTTVSTTSHTISLGQPVAATAIAKAYVVLVGGTP